MVLALVALPGCRLFYRNVEEGSAFTVYSNHAPELVADAAAQSERIYEAYARLFDLTPRQIGHTTIILRGQVSDSEVTDLSQTPDLLGYYVPILHHISINTEPPWTRQPLTLRQILLHEIAHHFAIAKHPSINDACWLNEGLASNLEMALFDATRFEFQLLNPPLLALARAAIETEDAGAGARPFAGVIDAGWIGFHDAHNKQERYALSWSIVHFLLERHFDPALPLGERIRRLAALDAAAVASLDGAWREFLAGFDLTGTLVAMAKDARDRPLSAAWALEQLGSLIAVDRVRAARALHDALADPDIDVRAAAARGIVRRARESAAMRAHAHWTEGDDAAILERSLAQLGGALLAEDTPAAIRRAVVVEAGEDLLAQPEWIPAFIALLDTADDELRALAIQGLATTRTKPTIVNPAFWSGPAVAARAEEILEWRRWWQEQLEHAADPEISQAR